MVYCGKPSRGCQMCRTRRIKCDESKPTCKQCAKSRRQCPGYKDEFDLVFRNETQATERRAQKASRKAPIAITDHSYSGQYPAQPARSCHRITADSGHSRTSAKASEIIPLVGQHPEELATCHFMSNFVLIPRQGSTRGFMDYLVPLMKERPADSPVHHAFNACALASFGNRVTSNNINFESKALGEYVKALSGTHAAIKEQARSGDDGVLAAVLLLGLFESITAKQMGLFAWGSHIEGAIQIVKTRGREQLQNKTGLLLFIAVRTQMIIHTLASGKAPTMGVEWWLTDAVHVEVAARCQRLCIKVAEIRAEVVRLMSSSPRTCENIELMLDMIRRVQTVDQDCVNWLSSLPEMWRFKTVGWEDHVPNGNYENAEVFPGRVDLYADLYIASVTNMARTSRLLLSSLLVRCAAWVCAPVDYRTTPEYATAARTCVDTITDIIASVPFHLGWHLKRPEIRLKHNLSGFACGDEDCLKGLAGYFLTWPLMCINGQDYATDAQRAWCVGRLKYICNELGVRYAGVLAEIKVRIPSMLIRRDGFMAQPNVMAQNLGKPLAGQHVISTPASEALPLSMHRKGDVKEKAHSP